MSSSPTSSKPMLFVGQQCSDEHCYLVDFLPFKCQHCSKSYCGDHFKPNDHNCEKYDASKFNRVAPSCPICNQPVAIPPDQDPNVKMTYHIERECGKRREEVSKIPRCANGKCHKVLYAPIKCDTCRQQFCAEHRFPASHKCISANNPVQVTKPIPSAQSQPDAGARLKQAIDTGSAKTSAGMAAIRRAMNSSTNSTPTGSDRPSKNSTPGSSTKPLSSHTNPFSKTDRWVVNPLESSVTSHSGSNAPPSPSSASSIIIPRNRSPQPQSCKSDLMNEPTNLTTTISYHPPPLFAH